ncbi:MAG: CotH kinase family protein [Ruminococcus sp.]|nr:CotH kinase family protein [Ruminococcus sp.]
MSAHKNIDKICIIITVFTLIIGLLFCNGSLLGIETTAHAIGYENRIFDNSRVHKIDIVINDWDGFLETCESEQYSACNLVIDGEAVKNVGIRGKGNTSLSSVKNMDSNRYSFKIEFDQYENGNTYHGLDKLCLNNIIQDNTYMKDYIAYTMMYNFGVDTPLCSYVDVSVNGEEWGLYLAVESVEDSFLKRNYGEQYGDLYKPDSMSFGGGRGNGMDFDMKDFMNDENSGDSENNNSRPQMNFGGGNMPPDFSGGGIPDFGNGEIPENFNPDEKFGDGGMPDFGGGFGMGSDDVKLKYTDDEISSYSNIFNNAKTTVNTADKKRLIKSLKALYEQSDIESIVDVDEVLRYFVVHNFLVNGDSYTGQMIHNYYLYEKNGQLSMIPWDYNLAFGSFQGGSATSSVNSPIDTPVSSGNISDRPMVAWIFDNEDYTEQYHQLFNEFINSVDFEKFISETAEMIDKYVQNDATKFCTYEEFQKGVETIKQFCKLRSESIKGQLAGTIPSTSEGQKNSSTLIDASDINTSDMGTMNMGGGGPGRDFEGRKNFGRNRNSDNSEESSSIRITNTSSLRFENVANQQQDFSEKMTSGDFDPNNIPNGFNPNNMPEGFDPNNMPDGFAPNNMQGGFKSDENVSESEKSDNPENDKLQNNRGDRPQMIDFNPNGSSRTNTSSAWILLGISAAVLLGGLGFAFKFKR